MRTAERELPLRQVPDSPARTEEPMRACRVDNSHGPIRDVLEAHGWTVLSLAAVGDGCPDLLCHAPGSSDLHLIECKTPGNLRPHSETAKRQAAFAARFPVARLSSVEEAEQWLRSR